MKPKFKIGSKDQAFWNAKKLAIEQSITAMEGDLKALPKLIEFNKEVIKLLKKKIRKAK